MNTSGDFGTPWNVRVRNADPSGINFSSSNEFDSTKAAPTNSLTMQTLTSPPIWLDDRGTAWVDDTNTKVREIALDVIAHGWSPKEIHLQHPHLSLAQIHAALGFYYDHKPELDAEIETALRGAEVLRTQMGESPIRQRLAALRRPA